MADVPAITSACQDPDIPRWTTVPSPYTEEDARAHVERTTAAWAEGRAAHFAIVEVASQALAGSISLWIVKRDVGELGYWATRGLRGRGYTTRALALLARWGFDDLGLARLQLGTLPGNRASERVAEKVGFRREGVLRAYIEQGGERRDVLMWSLLPGELQPRATR